MLILESDQGLVVNPFYPLFRLRGESLRVLRVADHQRRVPVLLWMSGALLSIAILAVLAAASTAVVFATGLAAVAVAATRVWLTPVVSVSTYRLKHHGMASIPFLMEHVLHFTSLGMVMLAGGLHGGGDWALLGSLGLLVAIAVAVAPIVVAFKFSRVGGLRR